MFATSASLSLLANSDASLALRSSSLSASLRRHCALFWPVLLKSAASALVLLAMRWGGAAQAAVLAVVARWNGADNVAWCDL